jgi:hypothetical protein
VTLDIPIVYNGDEQATIPTTLGREIHRPTFCAFFRGQALPSQTLGQAVNVSVGYHLYSAGDVVGNVFYNADCGL